MRRLLQKAFKKDKLIVKKTDDELVRYIKQTRIMEQRKKYEEELKRLEERRKKGLNVEEKKYLYHRQLETLNERVYDKAYINDNMEKLYGPWLENKTIFFIQPIYSRLKDYQNRVGGKVWAIRILGSLIMIKAGYEFGIFDCTPLNKKLAKSVVVDMEAEEQIFDYLYNKNKTAVFVFLYSPGHWLIERFNRDFEIESAKYQDEIVFMRVHCRKHLNFCLSKMWPKRIQPAAEAYFINEQDELEIVDFNNKHRSGPGIEAFFEEQGIIEQRLAPDKILDRIGQKYLNIL